MITLALLLGAVSDAAARPLSCDIGPVERRFGGSAWDVYACRDGGSLAILAKPDNPAAPYCFTLRPAEGGYVVERSGDGAGAAHAASEIAALGASGTRLLLDEAWAAPLVRAKERAAPGEGIPWPSSSTR